MVSGRKMELAQKWFLKGRKNHIEMVSEGKKELYRDGF
jgi:hypothetical protein